MTYLGAEGQPGNGRSQNSNTSSSDLQITMPCVVYLKLLNPDSPSESFPVAQEERDELDKSNSASKTSEDTASHLSERAWLGVGESYIMIITVILAQIFNPTTDC